MTKPGWEPKDVQQAMARLVEECAEVIKNVAKAQRFGLMSHNPDAPVEEQESNLAAIMREVSDVHDAYEQFMAFVKKDELPTDPAEPAAEKAEAPPAAAPKVGGLKRDISKDELKKKEAEARAELNRRFKSLPKTF